MGRRFSGNGGGGSLRAVMRTLLVPSATGVVATIKTGLKAPVTFGTKTGNANLSVPNANGQISATAAIAAGASQTIAFVATGADGCTQPWSVTLTGQYVIAAIAANVSVGVASGAIIANITGVPAGVTPVLSPADGRFLIAGDQASGWKIARGLSAISVGTFTGSVSAAGAVSGAVTLTIASEAPYTFTNSEAAAFTSRMTAQPTNARKAVIDETYSRLKINASGTNLLTAGDILTMGAAHDAQASRQNWIADQYHAVVEGAPVFVVDRGYTMLDSSTDALSFGVGANSLTQFSQNSASMAFWGRNHTINQSLASIGNTATSGSMIGLTPRNSSGLMASRINSASATSGAAVSTSWGLNAVDRSSSTAVQHYKNGATNGSSGSATSSTKSSATLKLRGLNQHNAAWFGRSLSAAEHLALYDAINYYLTAVGVTELVATTPTWASEAAAVLPDGVAPLEAGKGLNGLGCVRDAVDGTWWIARGIGSGSMTAAGVAHVSADFSTVIADWTLTDFNNTDTGGTLADLVAGSCQGITIDTTNQTIWVVNKIANQFFQINKSGQLLQVLAAPSNNSNGLTYDAIRDQFIVGLSTSSIVWLTKSMVVATGSAAKSIQMSSTEYGDQIKHDPTTDTLYMSKDAAQNADCKCEVWPLTSSDYPLPYRQKIAFLENSRAIEGVDVYGGKLFTVCDGTFHGGNTPAPPVRNDNHWRRHAMS